MKQTAVEWLVDELNKNIGLTKFVVNCDEAYKQEILGIIQQAKEMEKEQIREAFINGEVARDRIDSIEYYFETYGR
jgi:hypothetical protein